jgi:spore coat protein H
MAAKFPSHYLVFLIFVTCFGYDVRIAAAPPVSQPALFAKSAPGFFAGVIRLKIHVSDAAQVSLRANPRTNVAAMVVEGNDSFSHVLLHLKGTSTFQPLDKKPSLTLRFPNASFHGLAKIHLNNSLEDPSFLNEFVGSQMFHMAGLQAARVTHALVELNGRPLGLYVLKEGFSEPSVTAGAASGDLYEPGPGHDVDEPLRLVFGNESHRTRLQSLALAAREPVLSRRWLALNQFLEMDSFLSFMALEVLLNHRDGYCMARNNFRLYYNPATARFTFLPHGMDQLFGKTNANLLPGMSGMVAAAVMAVPQGRALYKAKLQNLSTNVFRLEEMDRLIQSRAAVLQPLVSGAERRDFEEEVRQLRSRIAGRIQNVLGQLSSWSRLEPRFVANKAIITNWVASSLANSGKWNITEDGKLHIRAEQGSAAAWKTRLLLNPGHYRFSALVKTQAVQVQRPAKNPGARLRVVALSSQQSPGLTANQPWRKLEIEFTITDNDQPVELLCELNADSGEAWWNGPLLEWLP